MLTPTTDQVAERDFGVSPTVAEAWALTRRISPRADVRMMRREADGAIAFNDYSATHRLGPAIPNAPWAVKLADEQGRFRLLCFDFDSKTPELIEQAHDECDALVAVLTAHGIQHVVCESSASRGRHVWIAVAGGIALEQLRPLVVAAAANFPTLDHGMLANAAQGCARPPLAPHANGSFSTVLAGDVETLVSPTVTAEELVPVAEQLTTTIPAPRSENSVPVGQIDVAFRAHRTLTRWGENHMATVDGGADPSRTAFLCLLAAANAGWTLTDVAHAVSTAPGMEHYRTKNDGRGHRRARNPREASERLARQWAKAQAIASLHRALPAGREPQDLRELDAIVTSVTDMFDRLRVTPGRWGSTEAASNDRSILTAVAYLTLQTGKPVVAASIRDLGLMVGLGRTTAARALHALTEAGFIRPVARADGANAAEWTLAQGFSTASGTVRSQPFKNPRPAAELFALRAALVTRMEGDLTDENHDLFTRAGFGHLAGRLYALLRTSGAVTVDSATRMLGSGGRYTIAVLSRLRTARLVVRTREGWARSKQDLRTRAAQVLGVAGVLAARRRAYELERDVWAWWLAEYATMTSAPRARPRRPHVTARPTFTTKAPGERMWPRYPRNEWSGLADHRTAREYAQLGYLDPENPWQLSDAA